MTIKKSESELVQDNAGLVHSLALKYCRHGIDYDDLCQVGFIGLINAIRSHKPEKSSLCTYMYICASRNIIKFVKKEFKYKNNTVQIDIDKEYEDEYPDILFDTTQDETLFLDMRCAKYTYREIKQEFGKSTSWILNNKKSVRRKIERSNV